MLVFDSLVKALLLHETTCTADQVSDPTRKELLRKVSGEPEYQDWLADRFFVFYLNRTRTYQGKGHQAKEVDDLQLVKAKSSIESRYIGISHQMVDSTPSEILDQKTL